MKRLALLLILAGCAPPSADRGLVVLGIDGMDPQLLRQLAEDGQLPNLRRLMARGGLQDLATSNPPQSPVAWSEFITGHGSEVHGIYDFLHRDPATRLPYLSTSRAEPPSRTLGMGGLAIPLGGGVTNLRQGVPFWAALAEADVPVTVLKVPAEYPPAEYGAARVLSGMGTPDLLGTPGVFQVFTSDPQLLADPHPAGGRVHHVTFLDGRAELALEGPPNPLRASGETLTLPISFAVQGDSAWVRVAGQELLLTVGEWTGWLPIAFDLGGLLPSLPGQVRLHLAATAPHPSLYVSPINIDPHHPAQRISAPESWASEIADEAGRYYTQGMPEDTKALQAGVLGPRAFLEQSAFVFDERERMLRSLLDDFTGGLLFAYFPSIDLTSHVFYRSLDPQAPAAERPWADAIPAAYRRADALVGRVLDALPRDTELVVLSDHGFSPWTRQVHLNTWLKEQGYLVLRDGEATSGPALQAVDWGRSRAYALGLNQIFLNVAGRESGGIVSLRDRRGLGDEISTGLRQWMDGETPVVTDVAWAERHRDADRVPDLLVGYNRGYRSSDASALGSVGTVTLQDNEGQWSGDHCMDPAKVPGVLLSTLPTRAGGLRDLAPSFLTYFGIAHDLPGASILGPPSQD